LEGFYAVPAGEGILWHYAFFIYNGIKMRAQKRQVGRILSDAGIINETHIGEALNIQQKLRSRRVGEILAETANLKQELSKRPCKKALPKVI